MPNFDCDGGSCGRFSCSSCTNEATQTECSRNKVSLHAEESAANARLIAAAPDLLAALEAIMATRTTPWRKDAMEANSLAVAAIAKAKGEKR